MPRGVASEIGSTFVNRLGYEYTKVKDRGWVGTHVLIMEEHIGRQLRHNEYITFKNGHRPPITLDMLELRTRGDRKSTGARIAEIKHRIEQLQAELEELETSRGKLKEGHE